jgi:predicted dehydrogenase
MKKISQPWARRRFLGVMGAAIALPTLIPARVLGADAPSKKITVGAVGWGTMGPGNTENFLHQPDCQVVAICDLDKHRLKGAADHINEVNKNHDCQMYHDYRELMARKDIDAVMLAVPDHWHALVATEAAKNQKDIYGEKPLARTIVEQRAIVQAVQANQRIWQTGSWQRSQENFHKGAEIVRNGLIGKVTRVEVGLPSGPDGYGRAGGKLAVTTPPDYLDYETWIGPSRMYPYIEGRVHENWRWNYNTGGGQLLDWIGHHGDIAHWGLGFDDNGPLEIEGHGEFPAPEAIWNTCTKYYCTLKYPNDITMIIAGGYNEIRGGTKWIGTDGWVWVDRGGFDCSIPELKAGRLTDEQRKIKLIKSTNHVSNFVASVKSRQPTVAPVEAAHHSAIPGHLCLIAMLVGRKIKWDAQKEVIVGDAEAAQLLTRPYREPWKLA